VAYHSAGTRWGTATFKFYEGRDILYAEAVAAFDRALQIDPADADALEGKIIALRLAKELDAALDAVAGAVQAQPDSLAIWYQAGYVRLAREEYAERLSRVP
jgi:tetratricopeptide (TPR) repeat protein